MDQPGKVANPARGQLNRENNIPLSPCVPENLVLRDGFSRPVPRQPAHLHTQAESGAYLRDSSRVPRWRPFMKPPYAIGSVPSLPGHAIAYRWRSLPRVRRHRASKPQGSSERVLPSWQITMGQLIFASLSHTHHYWYEVGILKVPAKLYPVDPYSAESAEHTYIQSPPLGLTPYGLCISPPQKNERRLYLPGGGDVTVLAIFDGFVRPGVDLPQMVEFG